jgi:hypothetical protein
MNGTKYAYSALPALLLKQRLTVAQLYQRLEARGFHFDRKSVYRLAQPAPLRTLNMPLVGAICDELAVPLERLIQLNAPAPVLSRIDSATQDRLDELLSRNSEGTLAAKERRELEGLVERVEQMSLENARLLARHRQRKSKPVAAPRKRTTA